jgi:hypothetical protein
MTRLLHASSLTTFAALVGVGLAAALTFALVQ